MKRKLIRYRSIMAMIITIAFASACLKDDRYIDFSKVTPTAEILGTVAGTATAATLSGKATDTITVNVNVTGSNAPTSDVTLTLGVSQAAIDVYNKDASHVAGTILPSNAYTIPASVTIKAGKDAYGNNNRSAQFQVILTEANIPITPGVNYVLPIAITGAPTGYIVSGNQAAILYNFYHNPYDGTYTSTGTRYNFNVATDYTGWDLAANAPKSTSNIAATLPWGPFSTQAITVNATNTLVHEGNSNGGFGQINLLVNADNTVLISSTCPANDGSCAAPATAVASLFPLPGVTSTYDPSTKTFNLYYQYTNASGTFRVLHDVMVHQ